MTTTGPSAAFCQLHRAGTCRSCPHQDQPLAGQLVAKQARVAALLADGAAPLSPSAWLEPVASAPARFRNKAKMVVSGTVQAPSLGILGSDGHGVDLRACPLHVETIEQALAVLAHTITRLGLVPYDVAARRGELKHLLVTASPDGDLMVRWVLRSHRHVEVLRRALPRLRSELGTLAVMSVNIQPVHQAIIEGEEEIVLTEEAGGDRLLMRLELPGPPCAEGPVGDQAGAGRGRATGYGGAMAPAAAGPRELSLLLPTRSFFQTNTGVAQQLYSVAARWAGDLTTPGRQARIWDLFCGVGGFALALAGPGRQVLGVEVSAPAIDGAREASRLMGLGEDEVRFEAGDARVLDPGAGSVPDLLVVNPPRRGIGQDLAARIEAAGVDRVLYSSCNPVSLARDLEAMGSYTATRAQLFDMFPHTDHAEVLVELRRSPTPSSRTTLS
ncbi:methyltransferase domain-containing protein [Actinomyces faecalis]|uniref:methyltransferase domain-containing protein n=1 Tax=Actinomyces faecalis TaxID=2722820 RepID=UPI001552ADA8|nr:methyltransferase domain-containing protein [Actinomyces faecalis]